MPDTLNLSGALALFSDHLVDIRKACVENVIAVQARPHKRLDDDDEPTAENISLHVAYLQVSEQVKPMLQIVKRIDGRMKHKGGNQITDAHIQAAKEVPIEDLYEGQLFGRKRQYGICPFHQERTPSFYIFPNNRFKCFGCQVHGTPIDYVMLRDNVPFTQAVKTLRGA
jgi:hypothetical protein